MLQGSLLMLWMDENMESTIKPKFLLMKNLQLLNDSTSKQSRTTSTQGIELGALNK